MILLQTSKQIKRSLTTTTHHLIKRNYSFESGRNRKPNTRTTNESQSTKPNNEQPIPEESSDQKPIITGHGRRGRHNKSSNSNSYSRINNKALKDTLFQNQIERLLPFIPLPFDHLSHLKPKVLSLDRFFSLQRPLLEIELELSERRSITLDSRLDSLTTELDELDSSSLNGLNRDTITIGSPSDPSFKAPQASNGTPLSDCGVDEGFEDELWGAVDGYAPYLITEPDGIDPNWSRELKHYLATASAFVPPPIPTPTSSEVDHSNQSKVINSKLTEEEQKIEESRLQDIQFLAPYGTSVIEPSDSDEPNVVLKEYVSTFESGSLPEISQDPHSLMLQAARFLHSGLTSIRWPSVIEWETIRQKLRLAESKFNSTNDQSIEEEEEEVIEMIKAVRGNETPKNQKSSKKWLKLTIENDHTTNGTKSIINLDSDQLNRIIQYSEILIKEHFNQNSSKSKVKLDLSEKELMNRFERLGEFLIKKHQKRNQIEMNEIKISVSQINESEVIGSEKEINSKEETNKIIKMDSVQRKRKRKMKVHKYKKRRKAQRSLRKRQGRD